MRYRELRGSPNGSPSPGHTDCIAAQPPETRRRREPRLSRCPQRTREETFQHLSGGQLLDSLPGAAGGAAGHRESVAPRGVRVCAEEAEHTHTKKPKRQKEERVALTVSALHLPARRAKS